MQAALLLVPDVEGTLYSIRTSIALQYFCIPSDF